MSVNIRSTPKTLRHCVCPSYRRPIGIGTGSSDRLAELGRIGAEIGEKSMQLFCNIYTATPPTNRVLQGPSIRTEKNARSHSEASGDSMEKRHRICRCSTPPSVPWFSVLSLLPFTIDPPPTLHTEYSTKQSDGRNSLDFLIYSALRKERSVSSFQRREGERRSVALATPPPPPRRGLRRRDPHGWKTPTHCSNMPFAKDRTRRTERRSQAT